MARFPRESTAGPADSRPAAAAAMTGSISMQAANFFIIIIQTFLSFDQFTG